jgi:molybdenum cofactor cytidylyltransferase
MTTNIHGIVLAAGASSRMGKPKPLLEADGTTFLERAIKLLRTAGCTYVVAVVNESDDWIARVADTAGAAVVINDRPDSEQIDSLRLAIANLPEGYDAVVVMPVDFPRVQQETVTALLQEYTRKPAAVMNPAHEGNPGHPVIFSRDVVTELLRPDLPDGARSIIERHTREARTVEVEDPGVLIDIDTPADYQQHVGSSAND